MTDQEKAFEKLSKLKVGALFMEMGTGKTKVALDLIASKKEKIDYILWICPFSIKSELMSEKNKWHPELEIEVAGCESIGSSDRIYIELLNKVENFQAFIVVDESLKIKNSAAKRTQRILKLGEYAEYKLILNGTPVSRNIMDIYTQMEFLSPKILKMSENEFKNTFCEYYLRGKLKGVIKEQVNIPYLISLIQPYIFDSKLEINAKKRYMEVSYSMNDKEKEEYECKKEEILSKFQDDDRIDFYRLVTELQSLYSGCDEINPKLNSLIKNIDGQVIVYVKFLKNIPDGAIAITGSVPNRAQIIENFQNNKFKTLYITYGCGAFGLNFQNCNNIIFRDHTWDYAQREQAEARIYRIGQKNDVKYYDMVADIGLEKMIRKNQVKKSDLLIEIKKEIEQRGLKDWLKDM